MSQQTTYTFQPGSQSQLEGDNPVEIIVEQGNYKAIGNKVWTCGEVLSDFLFIKREKIKNSTVVELGSGLGLCGLLCSRLGAKKVYLTDSIESSDILSSLRKNVELNNLNDNICTMPIEWGIISEGLFNLDNIDVIIGSDTFYNREDFEPLIATVAFLLEKNPNANFITTYCERSPKRTIQPLLDDWGLEAIMIEKPDLSLKKNGDSVIHDEPIFIYHIFKPETKLILN
ncbi:hypothetical protein K502DRAFT_346920 [Neoconidiobolus thromboides FSU 785]|nr:hypothetical protein K502DRAFT_346920 [Neoconidiobolus thromboides FSU 785]